MITKIKVSVARLVNLGKYENVRYECEAESQVQEGQDPQAVYQDTLDFCRENIRKEVERLAS